MVNLPIEYSDKKVAPCGHMSLMKRFVDSIGMREQLVTLVLPVKASYKSYKSNHKCPNVKREWHGLENWTPICDGCEVS